jgi:hypothetical protein
MMTTRDDNYSPFRRREPVTPKLDLVEACWRFVVRATDRLCAASSKRPWVRCFYSDVIDDLQRSEPATDIDIVRDIAEVWRTALLEKDSPKSTAATDAVGGSVEAIA